MKPKLLSEVTWKGMKQNIHSCKIKDRYHNDMMIWTLPIIGSVETEDDAVTIMHLFDIKAMSGLNLNPDIMRIEKRKRLKTIRENFEELQQKGYAMVSVSDNDSVAPKKINVHLILSMSEKRWNKLTEGLND